MTQDEIIALAEAVGAERTAGVWFIATDQLVSIANAAEQRSRSDLWQTTTTTYYGQDKHRVHLNNTIRAAAKEKA